jgi:hypothetical protein
MVLISPQIISPLDIATNGFLANVIVNRPIDGPLQAVVAPALTIATMGWIVILEEEVEEEIEEGGGGISKRPKKRLRKKITAKVLVDGVWYSEVAYTENVYLKLKEVNVDVELDEEQKPKITILLPEVKNDRD